MEPLIETIELDPEESNELAFKIKVEGSAPAPAKVRLVCEASDMSFMFNGRGTGEDGVVQFTLPQMSSRLKEGTYGARVEVLIENRYFAPVQFQISFKKAMKVVAESLQVVSRVAKPDFSVTAQPLFASKPRAPQPIVVEEPKKVLPLTERKAVIPAKVQQPAEQKKPTKGLTLRERYAQKFSSKKDR